MCAPAGKGQKVTELCKGSGYSHPSTILSAPHWIAGLRATARQQEVGRSCPEPRPSQEQEADTNHILLQTHSQRKCRGQEDGALGEGTKQTHLV